jgi:hypothetical protein
MNDDETEIRELAYSLWEKRGRPDGSPDEDWFAAEWLVNNEKMSGFSEATKSAAVNAPRTER